MSWRKRSRPGIEDIIVITGRGKRAIEDHFDRSLELEENLKGSGKGQVLNQMRHISNLANFCYVRQPEAMGLGHAVLCAQHLIGDEPFAVILGDEIIDAAVPGSRAAHPYIQATQRRRPGCAGSSATRKSAGTASFPRAACETDLHRVDDLIEKPAPADAPSNLAVIGRYVLPPEIFPILRKTPPGKNGEIQLTDALRQLVRQTPMFAHEIQGQRHDAGDKLGFLIATVELALKNPSLGPAFGEFLQQRLQPGATDAPSSRHRPLRLRPDTHHQLALGVTECRRPNRATARHRHSDWTIIRLEPHG